MPADVAVPDDLVDRARVLDNFYVAARYPNSHPARAPFEHYGDLQSKEALARAVRSLSSSVLRWPEAQVVDAAVRRWAGSVAEAHRDVVKIGYFGSYARGDRGVGSDVDLIVVVSTPTAVRATRDTVRRHGPARPG